MDPNVLTCYKSPFQKLRLGQDHDGGYIIADVPNINYDIILACGISNDISFEEDFLKKYTNVKCFAYDGTIKKLPQLNDKIQFIKKNIGMNEDNSTTNLHDIINTNDEIFIKMDIEGAEIPWINSLTDEQINKFQQIVIEFHRPFTNREINVFNKINKNHYLIHLHGNNCCGTRIHKNVRIPNIFECTYLHKKYFINPPELNTDLIPSDLDMSNAPWHAPEITINYPPFVH